MGGGGLNCNAALMDFMPCDWDKAEVYENQSSPKKTN